MFERLGIITFVSHGWIFDYYSDCHVYLDGSRILLKHEDYIETYICSETNMDLNFSFIQTLKTFIKLHNNNEPSFIDLKQLLSFRDNTRDNHTKDLQNFIINMLPGKQFICNYENDPNFIYKKENSLLICHNDYADFFLQS